MFTEVDIKTGGSTTVEVIVAEGDETTGALGVDVEQLVVSTYLNGGVRRTSLCMVITEETAVGVVVTDVANGRMSLIQTYRNWRWTVSSGAHLLVD